VAQLAVPFELELVEVVEFLPLYDDVYFYVHANVLLYV